MCIGTGVIDNVCMCKSIACAVCGKSQLDHTWRDWIEHNGQEKNRKIEETTHGIPCACGKEFGEHTIRDQRICRLNAARHKEKEEGTQ